MRGFVASTAARVSLAGTLAAAIAVTCLAAVLPQPRGTPATTTPRGPAMPSAQRGAAVPFTTYEAESADAKTNGAVVRMTKRPTSTDCSPELEASGRGYVELKATGDYVEFPKVRAASGLVIRNSIPDAPEGGGITATLGLYVNGVRRQSLTLSSKHNWLYGAGEDGKVKIGENGQSNTPTPFPHVFWDEARAVIAGGVRAGDTVRLQKDDADTAAFYRIDLVELETVPPPLPQPPGSLSVADFGAKGQDAAADTAAIQKCIDDAKAQGKTVWMPPGKYLQCVALRLDGVRLQGAGMWYTSILYTPAEPNGTLPNYVGFRLMGDGAAVSDLYIDSPATVNRAHNGGRPFSNASRTVTPTHWSVKNVWITHTNVGFWIAGTDGLISGCRVRGTYADAININNGADRVLVENCHVRGCGDDGLAILSEAPRSKSKPNVPPPTQNVTFRHNTVAASWWGMDCDLAGGNGHVIEDNLFADSGKVGFAINLPSAYPMRPVTGAVIRRNTIVRGGSNFANQRRGAIWIFPGYTTIAGVVIEDNEIVEPVFRGIHCAGTQSQAVVFRRNRIDRPGEDAIVINREAVGSGVFEGNTVKNLPADRKPFANGAGETYKATLTGNSWQ